MAQEVTNFGRFYTIFHKLPVYEDSEAAKRNLVLQYTNGRTNSLKAMTAREYAELCSALEEMKSGRDELRRLRSIALKLMQELEIDTRDWAQVNDFCRHARIAGKAFARLNPEELKALGVKLRAIKRKGWHRKAEGSEPITVTSRQHLTYLISLADGKCMFK